ncbi:MAG: flavodoxin family protein [Candidatus Bathyarchaeota archaeon]|nr:flavodoxin family protein [Candidatus Bathyarchaeota archaeon]
MEVKRRILILAASPRKNGNSTTLALRAAEGVRDGGGEASVQLIAHMNISPCSACDYCRSNPEAGCRNRDDMQPLYTKIREAQGILFATPIYWFNMSAQMKLLIDRTYAVHIGDSYALTGKDVGVILTYEDEDVYVSGGVNALRTFQDIFRYVRANPVGAVYGTAGKPWDAQDNPTLMQKAYDLGKKLANPK